VTSPNDFLHAERIEFISHLLYTNM